MGWLAVGAGVVPSIVAWRANGTTTLRPTIAWSAAAWFAWGFALATPSSEEFGYIALCLTGCAGVAVLGARRPHVLAWNFVVLGLLCVMILPLFEALVIRAHSYNVERKVFLAAILLVTAVNYLPTRFAMAAGLAMVGCTAAYAKVTMPRMVEEWLVIVDWIELVAIALVPWAAFIARRPAATDPLNEAWFEFRDRFGFVWASRIREQYSAAVKAVELPIRLEWNGFHLDVDATETQRADSLALFRAVTKRFTNLGE